MHIYTLLFLSGSFQFQQEFLQLPFSVSGEEVESFVGLSCPIFFGSVKSLVMSSTFASRLLTVDSPIFLKTLTNPARNGMSGLMVLRFSNIDVSSYEQTN